MLRAILNKSWRQHPTRHQLYGHLPPITKTIQVRRTRHAGHCWRSGDELISDVLLWTPTHGRAKAGRPVRTYIQQLCEDTGCCPEELLEAMNDREKWRERVRDIRATSTTWWWWWWKVPWKEQKVNIKLDEKHSTTFFPDSSFFLFWVGGFEGIVNYTTFEQLRGLKSIMCTTVHSTYLFKKKCFKVLHT